MTKTMISVLAALWTGGCGSEATERELKRYAEQYRTEVGTTGAHIVYEFGSLEGRRIGQCSVTVASRVITIDKEWWEMAPETQREQLMYHEMAHCEHGHMEHVKGQLSILNPSVIDTDTYRDNRDRLVAELRDWLQGYTAVRPAPVVEILRQGVHLAKEK